MESKDLKLSMSLMEAAKELGCRVIDLTIDDLSNLVVYGCLPIRVPFTLSNGSTYQWVDYIEPKDMLDEIVDDGGYKELDVNKSFKIVSIDVEQLVYCDS